MKNKDFYLNYKNSLLLATGLFLCLVSISANAVVVDNSTITITNSSTQFSPVFSVSNAIDAADFTDYASNGEGTLTFIEFQLPAPMPMTGIVFTDRVTSALAQGTCCSAANQDFVTGYQFTLSIDNNFTNGDGITDDVVVAISGLVPPVAATSPADFTSTANLNGFVAQYIRWDVNSLNAGDNPRGIEFCIC